MENAATLLADLFHFDLELGWEGRHGSAHVLQDTSLVLGPPGAGSGASSCLTLHLRTVGTQEGLLLLRKCVPHFIVLKAFAETGKEISYSLAPVMPQGRGAGGNYAQRNQ